jgi:saccharopine dehydrogenase-like NADP-dependent oxidoreductase
MKIAIVGAGAMGAMVARELLAAAPDTSLVLIDANAERLRSLADALRPVAVTTHQRDAVDAAALAGALAGVAVVVNAAQYDVNLPVMQACLHARCHYLDLGGMFHMTRRQLGLDADFRSAGLTAVLGMGAAPGLTNVLAGLGGNELDSVDSIDAAFAASATDAPQSTVFVPPYSIRTIMQEFCEPSVQFIDGALSTQPPRAGRARIGFPDPIGAADCVYTLHSEPATLPDYFRGKGIRRVCWRLGLPAPLEDAILAFASAGLDSSVPLAVGNASVAPIDVLAASIERTMATSARPTDSYTEYGCLHVEVTGLRAQQPTRLVFDTLLTARGAPPDMAGTITAAPAAQAALMIARGESRREGVHGPEGVLNGSALLERLQHRGFVTTRREESV